MAGQAIRKRLKDVGDDWVTCAVIFPARVVRAGGWVYCGYIVALIGALLAGGDLLSDLFKTHIAQLEQRGEIGPDGARRLLALLPGFLWLVGAPFIIGVAALSVRLLEIEGQIAAGKFLRESLGAVCVAAVGFVPALRAAAIALIPLGAVSLLHDIVLIHFYFTALEAVGLIVAGAVLLSPVFARLLPLLTVPVFIVVRDVSGREAVRAAVQSLTPRIVVLTLLWFGGICLVGCVHFLAPHGGISVAAITLVIGVYIATTLGAVSRAGGHF